MKFANTYKYRAGWLFFLICVYLLIIYINSLQAPFVFDDFKNIVDRDALHLTRLSPDSVCRTFFKKTPEGDVVSRPLSNFSFALNYYFGRLQVTGYHLVNILIHLITACFLFNILCFLIKQSTTRFTRGEMLGLAGLATVLWAAHPIQIQAVTYIVQRMASLAALFYVLGLWSYLGFRRRLETGGKKAGGKWLALSVVFFLCAVLSKPNTVIFPVGLLLVEYFFFNKDEKGGRRLEMMAVFGGTGLVILTAGLFFLMKLDPAQLLAEYDIRPFTLGERLLTEPRVLFFYLSQLFYPVPGRFSIKHYLPLSHSLFDPVSTLLALAGVVVLVVCALYWGRRYPLIGLPVVFYFSHHLVESSIVPRALIYEHRNYLPSMFVFLPVALLLVYGLKVYKKRSLFVWGAIFSFATALVFLLGLSTHTRNQDWQSRKNLWKSALRVAPEIVQPYQGLGECYMGTASGNLDRALAVWEQGADKQATYLVFEKAELWTLMAKVYQGRRQYERAGRAAQKALAVYRQAIKENPGLMNRQRVRQGLAGNYYYLSHVYSRIDPRRALIYINKGLAVSPVYPGASGRVHLHNIKAQHLIRAGDFAPAIKALRHVLKAYPESRKVYMLLGYVMTATGNYERGHWFYRYYQEKLGRKGPQDEIFYLYLAENRYMSGDDEQGKNSVRRYILESGSLHPGLLTEKFQEKNTYFMPFIEPEKMQRRLQNVLCRFSRSRLGK